MSQKTAKNVISDMIMRLPYGRRPGFARVTQDACEAAADQIIVGLLSEGFRIIPKHPLQGPFNKGSATPLADNPAEAAQRVLVPDGVDLKVLVASLSIFTLSRLVVFIALSPPIEARKLDPLLFAAEAEIRNGGYA